MIYLDNAATTKPLKQAIEYAVSFNDDSFYNPSALYQGGINSTARINSAKDSILKAVGVNANEYKVIITSCGSESDNLAIFGLIKRGTFLTDSGEHSAVYKCFLEHSLRGNNVKYIELNSDGSVNTDKLYDYVNNNKVDFVSIVHVNNETGAINDVNTIAENIKKINPKIIFHSDGVQAFCKVPFRLSKYIDAYSLSAHKINGLKGVGALIVKKKLNVNPIIFGGGQEGGVRSGTENLFGIDVLKFVTDYHVKNISTYYNYVQGLKNHFINKIDKDLFKIISSENGSPYILCLSALGLKGEVMLHMLETEGVIVGNGSACSSRNKYSRTIEACGYKKDVLEGVIRVSFSNENTLEDVEYAVNAINQVAKKLKGIMY